MEDGSVRQRVTLDALERYYPRGGFARRLQPLPRYNCIYVQNAKAACTTILLWLHRIQTGDYEDIPHRLHRDHRLPRVEDIGWESMTRMLSGDAFRFSFVRDPIQRVESAYLDKVVRHRRYRGRPRLLRLLGLPEGPEQDVTLEQFVAALEMQEPIRMDQHWRPQHLNLMHGLVDLDLVGRLETFDVDLARVCEITGIPAVPVETRNSSTRPADSLFDGRPDLLRKVREVYALDFELYGY
jgi:hypothetical protein